MRLRIVLALFVLAVAPALAEEPIELGPRPFSLVQDMDEGPLKTRLQRCTGPFKRSDFSIGHRGAPKEFPEHTKESYEAAARMGAGLVECDVTFTRDRRLVCRHAQCDLHTTTNILAIPDLAAKCTEPFRRCCTSDLTLAEFKRLSGTKEGSDVQGAVLSHAESIQLLKGLGVKFIPELKAPEVSMPYQGDYTQQAYAQQMIDDYKSAGIPPADVFAQSFDLDDVLYWIEKEPALGAQAVYLDERLDWPRPDEVAAKGVTIVAPPIWALLTLDARGQIVPSDYARAAKAAGLDIIAWTLERDAGDAFRSIRRAIDNEGDVFTVLDVLAREVGVRGVFSDWPATTTFYANCMGR